MNNKVTGILLLLIYVCVATWMLTDKFVGPFNVTNMLRWSALYGIVSIAVAFSIITGGIDLSLGSLVGLVGCLLPMLLKSGWSIGAAVSFVLLLSAAIGLYHGLLITKLRLQPFIVTLCSLLILRGAARTLTNDQTQGFGTAYEKSLRLIEIGRPCTIETVLVLAGLGVALWQVLRLVRQRDESDRSQRPLAWFGVAFGVVLAAIGSSRFWHGFEWIDLQPGWGARVPRSGAELPAQLMYYAGCLAIPSGLWFLGSALAAPDRKTLFAPLAMLAASGAALAWVSTMARDDSWSMWWRIALVMLGLGAMLFSVIQTARAGLAVRGPAARLPLLATACTAVLWLVGQYFRESAQVETEARREFQGILVPAPFFFLVLVAVTAAVFLNRTVYGRYLLALGRNERAAQFSGINTGRMIVLAYVLCSALTGAGGVLFALEINSIQPSGHGASYELYAIAAAVLGGCSLRGGEGSILGVVIGAAVMRVLNNSINLVGIPSQLEYAIVGFVILLGVGTDELVRRVAARRRVQANAA